MCLCVAVAPVPSSHTLPPPLGHMQATCQKFSCGCAGGWVKSPIPALNGRSASDLLCCNCPCNAPMGILSQLNSAVNNVSALVQVVPSGATGYFRDYISSCSPSSSVLCNGSTYQGQPGVFEVRALCENTHTHTYCTQTHSCGAPGLQQHVACACASATAKLSQLLWSTCRVCAPAAVSCVYAVCPGRVSAIANHCIVCWQIRLIAAAATAADLPGRQGHPSGRSAHAILPHLHHTLWTMLCW